MKQISKIASKITIIQIIIIFILTTILTFILSKDSQAVTYYSQRVESGIASFPVGYQSILENLKNYYPNATFEAYYTGISWDELIAGETAVHTRNTVINSSDSSWKCSCGKGSGGYVCASQEIIEYYIDPRNFLNPTDIFQFLEISYNSSVHTLEGVQSAVKNTFLDGTVTFTRNGQAQTMSYAQIILEAAKQSNMSPYSITTKIIQEVGTQGSSSVTGTYPGYEGYYNFYNYGAYDSGNAIVNALIYARDKGWNNQYDAIVEGAKLLANSYTNVGQNTAYFYKWDVVGTSILKAGNSQTVSSSDLFSHQYMTNIQDPTNQAKRLYNTYAENGLLDKPLNFIIPIYESEGNSNKLPSGIDSSDPNAYYVNDSDGINVRSEPSLSGTKIAAISKDTVVLMQIRNYTTADGYSWDKIQLASGVVGYAASEFLSPCSGQEVDNTTSETIIGTCVTTDNLRLRKEASSSAVTLVTIPRGTTIEVIAKDVANDGTHIWYKVRYNGTVGYVAATYLTSMTENNQGTSASKGDVNGDGAINSADALKILKYSVGTEGIEEKYLDAADVNKDGAINSADALKILKYSVGMDTI